MRTIERRWQLSQQAAADHLREAELELPFWEVQRCSNWLGQFEPIDR